MQERIQTLNWKKAIFPLFLALAAFICFVILYWMGTANSLNPMYIRCLPFAIPFIVFLIIACWAGRNQISELSTYITCIILIPILVFSSWFYLFSLTFSSMSQTVTSPYRYERTITRFVDPENEWLAIFPDKIPKNAKDVSFYYTKFVWLDYSETAVLKFSTNNETLVTYEKKLSSVSISNSFIAAKDELVRALRLIGEQDAKTENYTAYIVYKEDFNSICVVFINQIQGTIVFFAEELRD